MTCRASTPEGFACFVSKALRDLVKTEAENIAKITNLMGEELLQSL